MASTYFIGGNGTIQPGRVPEQKSKIFETDI